MPETTINQPTAETRINRPTVSVLADTNKDTSRMRGINPSNTSILGRAAGFAAMALLSSAVSGALLAKAIDGDLAKGALLGMGIGTAAGAVYAVMDAKMDMSIREHEQRAEANNPLR